MNAALRSRIAQIRSAVEADPEGIVAGEVRPPYPHASTGVPLWDQFLAEADGGRFGSIDIWPAADLAQNQFYTSEVQGGSEGWLVIGQVLYEPLMLSRETGNVMVHPQTGDARSLGSVDHFLAHHVFGAGYADLVLGGEQDGWWEILRRTGR